MSAAGLFAALLCVVPLWAQEARPAFRSDRVIPSFGDVPLMLAPGMLVSIYGSNLGPATGCQGYGDQKHWDTLPADNPFGVWERIAIYPTNLCDVRVMVGNTAAGLTWVQAEQINFQVPQDVPFGGSADLRVIYRGAASDPAPLRFGIDRLTITQDEPAYAGMAVWVHVHTASDVERPLQFPFREDPLWFACNDLEVRHNGVALPRQTARNLLPRSIAGFPCGTVGLPGKPERSGRLPVHLLYRLDQPGTYEVRFTRMGYPHTVQDRSAWTAIQVLPATESRVDWVRRMPKPKSAADMLADYLPSLLGYGDAASLPVLVDALSDADELVRTFATNGLADYYERAELATALRARTSNEAITRLLSYLAH